MSPTLNDLRVATPKTTWPQLDDRHRPASLADLVEVLKQEGYDVLKRVNVESAPLFTDGEIDLMVGYEQDVREDTPK